MSRSLSAFPTELLHHIFSYMPCLDLFNLAQTSSTLKTQVQSSFSARLLRTLHYVLPRPNVFRDLMNAERIVLGGCIALSFLEAKHINMVDAHEIYVTRHSFDAVKSHLEAEQGFKELECGQTNDNDGGSSEHANTDEEQQPADPTDDTSDVGDAPGDEEDHDGSSSVTSVDTDIDEYGFCENITLENNGVQIKLICSATDSPLHPICASAGTIMVNAVTTTTVWCAYPSLLLAKLNFVLPGGRSLTQSHVISDEYAPIAKSLRQYGYTSIADRYDVPKSAQKSTLSFEPRLYKDNLSWNMDFGEDDNVARVDTIWTVTWFAGGSLGSTRYPTQPTTTTSLGRYSIRTVYC